MTASDSTKPGEPAKAGGSAMPLESPGVFLRKATGLVRGWSVRDSFIYACLSTNIITLGLYEFSFSSFIPSGQLLTSVVISGIWVSFLVITYAGLIVTIPRAGGDYIWQSRVLGMPLGFVLSVTGWWFILWLWAPIYGNILTVEFFQPLVATLGFPAAAAWFGTRTGIFVVCLITIALAGVLVSLGMAGYARVQKWCFLGGLVGFALFVGILLYFHHADFVAAVNRGAASTFGAQGNTYQSVMSGAGKIGYSAPPFGINAWGASMLLVPMMMFYLLWPNWGSSLYGEIRGASDFRRVFTGMFSGLWATVVLSVIFLLLMAKTFGFAFYSNANAVYWAHVYGTAGAGAPHIPIWPYPVMLAGWLTGSRVVTVILILLMMLWFLGWVGTLFLSSTRVIFAAAFDRVLPDKAAAVSERRKVPTASLVLMLLPAVVVSALYAYWADFSTYTLDATLVLAVTYLGTAVAALLLPVVKPELWKASPASRIKLFGIPVVPVAAIVTIGLLVYCLYYWLSDSAYGVNAPSSLIFMGILYALAIAVFVIARLVRRRQGLDLSLVNKEIPVE